MASSKLRLDHAGMGQILRYPEIAALVSEAGQAVAANVGSPTATGEPIPVRVTTRTAGGGGLSARPAVDITLAHVAGKAVEAKRGPLARAAAAAGLEVTGRR